MTTLNLLKNLKTVSNSKAIKGGIDVSIITSVTSTVLTSMDYSVSYKNDYLEVSKNEKA